MEAVVSLAIRHTPIGKICLLSTASPSYSLFRSYEDKGDQFQRCIAARKLIERRASIAKNVLGGIFKFAFGN